MDSTDVAAIEVRPSEPDPPRRFAVIAEPPSGDAPLAVQFSFAPDPLASTQVAWNFGDGSRGSTEFTPEHTYGAVGDYVVALTVTDDLGREAGSSFPVVVERSAVTARPTPAAIATPKPRDPRVSLEEGR